MSTTLSPDFLRTLRQRKRTAIPKDLTGFKSHRLTVVRLIAPASPERRVALWECLCACGKTSVVQRGNIITGHTKSCGCLSIETVIARSTTHGEGPRKGQTKEHIVWGSMKDRCMNPKNPKFARYGAVGITVCERWAGEFGYQNFLADMGRCPPTKRSIDRIDGTKGYYKENCRWADDFDQANNQKTNRKLTYAGKTMGLCQWSREAGIKAGTLWRRLMAGWSVERALTEKVRYTTEKAQLEMAI